MVFGQNLKKRLQEKGLTVAQVARRAEVPAKTIYHWLAGARPRDLHQVLRICRVLEVEIESLYGMEPLAPTQPPSLASPINQPPHPLERHLHEIEAGLFEVVLRRRGPRAPD